MVLETAMLSERVPLAQQSVTLLSQRTLIIHDLQLYNSLLHLSHPLFRVSCHVTLHCSAGTELCVTRVTVCSAQLS
jgi:hypothetical protein